MKILTVVGARPQFVKAAMVSMAMRKKKRIKEQVLHTGQHYDPEMSQIFFDQLRLPRPYKNLNVGSGPQGEQTGRMIEGIEKELQSEKPDCVLIYGDTNSTVAAALAAAKLHIPIAHVEAGLRSFNSHMPEEINRVLADRLADLLFVPTALAAAHLKREGIRHGIHRTGDVMVDAIRFFHTQAQKLPRAQITRLLPTEPYFVLTLHRAENTDDAGRLKRILDGLATSPLPMLFPIHPRTSAILKQKGIALPNILRPLAPVSYLEMIRLQSQAEAIWTDSGGMQKEAVVLGKRCYTLRDETEWTETVQAGWNQILGADHKKIIRAMREALWQKKPRAFPTRKFYGDGHASDKIASILANLS